MHSNFGFGEAKKEMKARNIFICLSGKGRSPLSQMALQIRTVFRGCFSLFHSMQSWRGLTDMKNTFFHSSYFVIALQKNQEYISKLEQYNADSKAPLQRGALRTSHVACEAAMR